MKNKALFLDRDGTINFDSNHAFDSEVLFLLEGASEAIALAQDAGYRIVVVTNQSCIGRGYATYQQVMATHRKMRELLLSEYQTAKIDLILTAPDHPDIPGSRRKPAPGMLHEAAENLSLDLSSSWIIGDKITDPQAGESAGIPVSQCLLVLPNGIESESEEATTAESHKYSRFIDLLRAVQYILSTRVQS
jgi:D-glycero-D-manno-heptose 1,7-bisphosphate phosphatase